MCVVVYDEVDECCMVNWFVGQFVGLCVFVVYVLLVVLVQCQLVEVIWYVWLFGYGLVDDVIYVYFLCWFGGLVCY